MVRINVISPGKLTDQHLVAEYFEILMLGGYVRKYPDLHGVPKNYTLGKGHVLFFKDKFGYLKKRHASIRKEMLRRGFHPRVKLDTSFLSPKHKRNWKPAERDRQLIKRRLRHKINLKPHFYRYYSEHKSRKYLLELLK